MMHSPSMITPLVANQVIADHAEAARAHRASRRGGPGRIARLLSRRAGASPQLVRQRRTLPPFAH